jgi:hypothetical protein
VRLHRDTSFPEFALLALAKVREIAEAVRPPKRTSMTIASESVEVGPGSSSNVVARVPVRTLPRELVVDPEIARHFLVADVKVGKNSQLASCGCLPAEMFTRLALLRYSMRFDVAEAGRYVVMSVMNTSGEPRMFEFSVSGDLLE